jgi:ankyrin repeat protein
MPAIITLNRINLLELTICYAVQGNLSQSPGRDNMKNSTETNEQEMEMQYRSDAMWFCNRLRLFGCQETEMGGVCFGYSAMAMQAFFSNEISQFIKRIHSIHHLTPKEIYRWKNDLSSTNEKEKLWDIAAFFDGMRLYQSPSLFTHILGSSPRQIDREASKWISPVKLDEDDQSMVLFHQTFGAYTKKELFMYLNLLQTNSKEPVSILLCSFNHAISLSFSPDKNRWYLADSSDLLSRSMMYGYSCVHQYDESEGSVDFLADSIYSRLNFSSSRESPEGAEQRIIMSSYFFTQKSKKNALTCSYNRMAQDSGWKSIHNFSPDRLKCRDSLDASLLSFVSLGTDNVVPAKELIESGADLIHYSSEHPVLPLRAALIRRNLNVAKLLLDHTDLSKIDIINSTHVKILSCVCGNREIVDTMIQKNMDINKAFSGFPIINDDDWSSLFYAVSANNQPVVSLLLEKAVSPMNHRSKIGRTVFHIAAMTGVRDLFLLIMNRENSSAEMIDEASVDGKTPLHEGAENGSLEIVQLLETKGVKMDRQTGDGLNIFHLAAKEGHLDILSYYTKNNIALGSQLMSQTDKEGKLPLHYAIENGQSRVVELLLEHGPKTELKRLRVNAQSPVNYAIQYAMDKLDQSLLNVLLQYSKEEDIGASLEFALGLPSSAFDVSAYIINRLLIHIAENNKSTLTVRSQIGICKYLSSLVKEDKISPGRALELMPRSFFSHGIIEDLLSLWSCIYDKSPIAAKKTIHGISEEDMIKLIRNSKRGEFCLQVVDEYPSTIKIIKAAYEQCIIIDKASGHFFQSNWSSQLYAKCNPVVQKELGISGDGNKSAGYEVV